MFADYVILNGEILTVDHKNSIKQAIAVYDNKIVWTGENEEAKQWIGAHTRQIDAGGASVLPGFIDAHLHMGSLGMQLKWADCSEAKSIEDIKTIIRNTAKRHPKGSVIRGYNYDPMRIKEKRHPDKEDLDEAAGEHKVILSHVSLHYSVLNSMALRDAGVDGHTKDPEGGYFERKNGRLTGLAAENAHWAMMKKFPVSDEELSEALQLADEYLSKRGITSVHDAGDGEAMLRLLTELKKQGQIQTRIYAMLFSFYGNLEFVRKYFDIGFHTGFGSDSYKIGPFKLMLDGSGIGGTAAVRAPYENDGENYGVMAMSQECIRENMRRAYKDGYQLTAHAIGDRAIETLIDTYESLYQQGRGAERDRIEHCYVGADDLFERIEGLSLLPIVQPGMLYTCGENYRQLYGKRTEKLFACNDFLKRGIRTAFSSDAPVIDANPLIGIYCACTRRDKNGIITGESQKISRQDAVRMYTINGAYASFEEDIKGSLEPGKLADLIILSGSLTTATDEELRDMAVKMTMINGRIVFEA